MASDLTTVAFLYKKIYSGNAPADIAQRMHPLFSRISKQGGFAGTSFAYAVRTTNPQGVGGTFATTQAASAESKGEQLLAYRKPKFGVITLDGEAMAACSDKGSFANLVTTETDGILEEMGDSFAFDLYRGGNGIRGRRASASTDVITLSVADDARNFKRGMTVRASANSDGSSPRTGSTTIAAIDEDAGTITLTSAAAITSFADNDYLFRAGDPGTCMEGLALCTPLTAPVYLSDSFRGIDRGKDPRRLAGSRLNDTANTIEENIGKVAIRVSQIGKKVDECYLNPVNWHSVQRRLNAKIEYEGGGGSATYGHETIVIATVGGAVRVVSDPDCPVSLGYLINSKSHYLKHLRGLPHIIEDDGRPQLRSTNADSIEARARGWVNYIQDDPSSFGVFAI